MTEVRVFPKGMVRKEGKVERWIASGEKIVQVIFHVDSKAAGPEPKPTLLLLEAIEEFVRKSKQPVYIGAIRMTATEEDDEWDVYFHELEL